MAKILDPLKFEVVSHLLTNDQRKFLVWHMEHNTPFYNSCMFTIREVLRTGEYTSGRQGILNERIKKYCKQK